MKEELSFKYSEARVLPVILLLDRSGSMNCNGNINVLNDAVKEMIKSFADNSDNNIAINVAIVGFGGDAKIELPLLPAEEVLNRYQDLVASGGTPLGGALTLAKQDIIERKDVITARAYRPTVVLVSDGMPNDNWKNPFDSFVKEGRSSKCYRIAMGIGVGKNTDEYRMLEEFVSDKEMVFSANQADQIKNFFKFVTMSTIARTKSANPNMILTAPTTLSSDDDDDDDLF